MLPLLILLSCVLTIMGFATPTTHSTLTHHSSIHRYPPTVRNAEGGVTSRNSYHHRLTTTPLFMTSDVEQHDPNETVARRIIVTGDVNGGYYRTCVINEVCIPVIYYTAKHNFMLSFTCAMFEIRFNLLLYWFPTSLKRQDVSESSMVQCLRQMGEEIELRFMSR